METVPATMRAVVFDRYGPPDVLRIAEVPVPAPKSDEVLVRVLAVSLNGGEVQGRSGRLRVVLGNKFPQRTGIDLVGIVVQAGESVKDLHPGDQVWAISEDPIGTAAEYFSVRRSRVSLAPRSLQAIDAVTLLAGGTTAITALRDKASLQPGDRLLVRGASGGVGSLAVQIGKLMGAYVTALARTEAIDYVRALGADDVIDYRKTALADLGPFDVIIDSAGSDHRALRRLLAPNGRMVAITIDMRHRLASLAYIAASARHRSRRVRIFRGDPTPELLTELAELADHGKVRPVVDKVYSLDRIADAHRSLETGGVLGKHVVRLVDADALSTTASPAS